ncbi:MAG: hypothetical protein KAT12_08800 [Gammaproteobacteria bacterium]|nr:hypothetical protein [Gammaproteobacteria bacterium]
MEEGEYKSTYNALTAVRCVFEKALTNKHAKCRLSKHFCLADREGYACESVESSDKCGELLVKLRENSTFVLKLHEINGPLPHNMEIRVQVGGLMGLAKLVDVCADNQVETIVLDDISKIISEAQHKYGALDELPYSKIIQSVVQFQCRRRRQR